MAILKRSIVAFFIACVSSFSCTAASAEDAVTELRIGLIGPDPIQLLHDFDPFAEFLKKTLRPSGLRDVTVFVAKDLNQMRARIQKGTLDFILTSALPIIEMKRLQLVPAVVAVYGADREDSAVFFVRKESSLRRLSDLQGKTIVFGTRSSTAAYAMAKAELKKNELSIAESTDTDAPQGAIRYRFAGEAINQAFRVIRRRADAGVFGSSDWEGLPPNEQSRLRIIHRTSPITRLFGSFHPSFPPVLREAVEKALIDASGNRKGRTALSAALNVTRFERLTEEDNASLQRLEDRLTGTIER